MKLHLSLCGGGGAAGAQVQHFALPGVHRGVVCTPHLPGQMPRCQICASLDRRCLVRSACLSNSSSSSSLTHLGATACRSSVPVPALRRPLRHAAECSMLCRTPASLSSLIYAICLSPSVCACHVCLSTRGSACHIWLHSTQASSTLISSCTHHPFHLPPGRLANGAVSAVATALPKPDLRFLYHNRLQDDYQVAAHQDVSHDLVLYCHRRAYHDYRVAPHLPGVWQTGYKS